MSTKRETSTTLPEFPAWMGDCGAPADLKKSKSSVEYCANYCDYAYNATAPPLKKSRSSLEVFGTQRSSLEKYVKEAVNEENIARYNEALAAWIVGKFNSPKERDAAVAEFFTEDLVYDVKSAAGHTNLPEMQRMYGFRDVVDLFDFFGKFDYEGVTNTVVAGRGEDEVWHLLEATIKHKETGKSAPLSRLLIATLEGGKIKKLVQAMHDPGSLACICSEEDAPLPWSCGGRAPPVATLPAFEPHPDPKSVWNEIVSLWVAGEFSKPDTKHAAIAKLFSPEYVLDATNSAAPGVLKTYRGHEGLAQWVDDVWAQEFELSNIGMEQAVDLKPGRLLWKLTCDAKLRATGKEAHGLEMYADVAINSDGHCVYQKFFYVNPDDFAAVYG